MRKETRSGDDCQTSAKSERVNITIVRVCVYVCMGKKENTHVRVEKGKAKVIRWCPGAGGYSLYISAALEKFIYQRRNASVFISLLSMALALLLKTH